MANVDIKDFLQEQIDLSPVTYQYYKNLQNRTLIINGEITCDIIESAVLPLIEWDNDGSEKPINIILNTNGGDVYSGMTLCSVIERLKCNTTITVLSMAASMGALIAMSGKNNPNVTTYCYPFSVFLIHSGSCYFEGSSNQVKDTMKFQEEYEIKLTEYILTHTTIPIDVYEKQTRYEWYMTASTAKEYGIVDEIL